MNKIILGIVGYAASGKDMAALHLWQEHGFINVSTGNMVRKYVAENNLGEPTRELLQKVANELREKNGAGYFAAKAIQENENFEKLIVSGIRTVGEAMEIKKFQGIIIAVDASQEIRFERAQGRGSARDNKDFESFKAIEALEAQNEDPNAQNIKAVIDMSDYKILNEGTVEDLNEQMDELINEILQRGL
ncbi:MAG: AAA family ATPase [bacterium]